jgi:hypothetical protein
VAINVQEIEAAGVADTRHWIVTSCPVTELYEFWGIFTVGSPRENKMLATDVMGHITDRVERARQYQLS